MIAHDRERAYTRDEMKNEAHNQSVSYAITIYLFLMITDTYNTLSMLWDDICERLENHIVYMVLQSFKQCQWAYNEMNGMLRRTQAIVHIETFTHTHTNINKKQVNAHLTCKKMLGEKTFKTIPKPMVVLYRTFDTHKTLEVTNSDKSTRYWFLFNG